MQLQVAGSCSDMHSALMACTVVPVGKPRACCTWAGLQRHGALPLTRKHAQRVQPGVRRFLEALGDGVILLQGRRAPARHVGARDHDVIVPERVQKVCNSLQQSKPTWTCAQQLLTS